MSSENIKQQVRGQMRIFAAVMALAIVSGVASMISDAPLILLVMAVATIQGALILAYLMHVKSEAAIIQSLLAFSAFFLIVLFFLTQLGLADPIEGTKSLAQPAAASETVVAEEH